MKISEKGYRPPIEETWNPAISVLMSWCWADDAELRPKGQMVLSHLKMIVKGCGRVDSSVVDQDLHLAPGALWRRVETRPAKVKVGAILGQGSFATVHKCLFINKPAALKLFRNTNKESAFKEIEMMFSLRHPNIIGLYAWCRNKTANMVSEPRRAEPPLIRVKTHA